MILQLEYSIDGVAQQHHKSVHLRKEVSKPQTGSNFWYSVSGPMHSSSAGAPIGAPIPGLSATVTPGSPTAKGVPVALSFRWTDRGTPRTLDQPVFVSYQGISTVTNGQFTMRAYFEPNHAVEPTRAQSGTRGTP